MEWVAVYLWILLGGIISFIIGGIIGGSRMEEEGQPREEAQPEVDK